MSKLTKELIEDLKKKNNLLEAKILNWYAKTKDEKFAEFMGITEIREGHIPPLVKWGSTGSQVESIRPLTQEEESGLPKFVGYAPDLKPEYFMATLTNGEKEIILL